MHTTEITTSDTGTSPTDSVESFAFISDTVHGSASNPTSLPNGTTPPNPHPPLNSSHATAVSAVHGQRSNHLTPRSRADDERVLVHRPPPNKRVLLPASTDDSWVWVDSPDPNGRVRSAASTADSVPSENGRPEGNIAHVKGWRAVDEVLYRDGDNCQLVFHGMPDIPNGLMLRFALRGHAASSIDFANASGFSNDLILTLEEQIAGYGRQRLRGFKGDGGRTRMHVAPGLFSTLGSWKNWPTQHRSLNWKACAHCIDAQDKEPRLPQSLLACSWRG